MLCIVSKRQENQQEKRQKRKKNDVEKRTRLGEGEEGRMVVCEKAKDSGRERRGRCRA